MRIYGGGAYPAYLIDADTLRITRYTEAGTDVFGEELNEKDVTVKISRK